MLVTEEEFLEHFGIAGMRWGVRKGSGSDAPSNRQLNKQSRKQDWQKQGKQVDAARAKVASGGVKKGFKTAKAQYKLDKQTMGSREAKKILNKKRIKLNETYSKSQEVRTQKGQVAAVAALVVLGAVRVAAASKY